MKYLLDTNILSEPLKASPDQKVMSMLQAHQDDLVTATLVIHELYFGCYRLAASRKRDTIEAFINKAVIDTIPLLPYCDKAAEWHAQERARLQKDGRTPSFADGQIAAIAFINRTTLVTRNISDFKYFSNIELVCWHSGHTQLL